MECLITGASGFVGRWLRSALIEQGFGVRLDWLFARLERGRGEAAPGARVAV